MKSLLLIFLLITSCFTASSQYSGLSVSLDNTKYCDLSTQIHVSGTIRANPGSSNGYHFIGLKFHFYYYNGSISEIGTYQIYKPAGLVITNTSSFNPTYFDGTQITGGLVTSETYSTSSPNNGGIFSSSFTLPYSVFPTRAGI